MTWLQVIGSIAICWASVALVMLALTGDSPRKWFRE